MRISNRLVSLGGVALPLLIATWFVAFYGVDVPYWDGWDAAPFLLKLADGSAAIADFLEQHTEHRLLANRLVIGLTSLAFGWHPKLVMLLNVLIVVLTLPAFFVAIRSLRPEAGWPPVFVFACAAILLSLNQFENWLWGWSTGWFASNCAFVWAIASIRSYVNARIRRLWFPALLCAFAAFSIAHGIVSWVAVVPGLLCSFPRRKWLPLFTLWALGCLGVALVQFNQYRTVHTVADVSSASGLADVILYSLATLGASVTREEYSAVAVGVVMIGATVVFVRRSRCARDGFAAVTSLALYSVAFALANGMGRAPLGLEQATVSRYTTTSNLMLLVVLLIPLAFNSDREGTIRSLQRTSLLVALIPLVSWVTVLPIASQQKAIRASGQLCLQALALTRDPLRQCSVSLYLNEATLHQRAMALHREGMLALPEEDSLRSEKAGGSFSIQRSGIEPFGRSGRRLMLRGVTPMNSTRPMLIGISVNGEPWFRITKLIEPGHGGEWDIALPEQSELEGSVLRAWVFDSREREFLLLDNEMRLGEARRR